MGASTDQAWQSSHYLAVYGVLLAYADSDARQLPAGTDGVLDRALTHFRRSGEREAAARLEALSILLFRLRQALLARDENGYTECLNELAERSREWLLAAPMFPEDPPLEIVAWAPRSAVA